MSNSRRKFLAIHRLVCWGAAAGLRGQDQNPSNLPPGAPPTFGTGLEVGPEVWSTTFAEAGNRRPWLSADCTYMGLNC
jgi:hypothetical protein